MITLIPDAPFYEGTGASVDVPEKWDVALNGRGYMLDKDHPAFGGQSAYLGRMGSETIPLIRQQADSSTEPGEASINPEDLWPRVQSSFHKGAGQKYLDAPDSDRNRFRASLGIDPWTRGQLNLLHDTTQLVSSTNTNLFVLRVGSYLYLANGTTLKFTATPYSSWTDSVILNGESSGNVLSICSDGFNVFAVLGADGIHKTTRGATSSTHYNDLAATLVRYVKGRLMAVVGSAIYNVTTGPTAPSALFTHPNTDFTWVDFAEGQGQIYAAGYSGDKSLIYRTAVKSDGTALDIPVVAGELPDGEVVRSIQGYLGFLCIGTDLGFRLATWDSSGNLTLGALVKTNTSVRCFEPQGQYVWFGWENYDSSHTGLGRIDLTIETDSAAPAYASDLMAATQNSVLSVATESGGLRVFCVSAHGLYIESASNVASGIIDTGLISFGIPDTKIALRVGLKHKPLTAGSSVAVSVNPDDSGLVWIGTSSTLDSVSPSEDIKVPEMSARVFELELMLSGAATLESYDFRAYPASKRGMEILVPILLSDVVETATGSIESIDVLAEYNNIQDLASSKRLVSYQELAQVFSVFVEDINIQRRAASRDRRWWQSTLLLKLKVLGD